jgi:hypothetical protein
LFFPEVTVEPLNDSHIHVLKLIPNTTIVNCESTPNGVSLSSAKEEFFASKVIICNGMSFKSLYPELLMQAI